MDKNGVPLDTAGWANAGITIEKFPVRTNANDPNYIANTGMGWFPGYAINVETGERINIMFGEDYWLINGNDMIAPRASSVRQPVIIHGLYNSRSSSSHWRSDCRGFKARNTKGT